MKNLKNLGSLLIFIILCQEIYSTATFIDEHRSLLGRNKKESSYNDNAYNDEGKKTVSTGTEVGYHKGNEKRFTAFAIASKLIVGSMMTASLTTEIVATVTNCEGIVGFEDLKTKSATYEAKLTELQSISDNINAGYNKVEQLAEYLNATTLKLETIWTRMEGINNETGKIVSAIDSDVYAKVDEITVALIDAMVANNETVDSFEDVSFNYDTVFDNIEDDLWRVHGFVTMPLSTLATWALQRWWKNKFSTTQSTSVANGATTTKVTKFPVTQANWIKNVGWIKSILAWRALNPVAFSRMVKVASGFYSLAMIGVEIWNIVKTIEGCKDLRDDIDGYIDDIDLAIIDANELLVETNELYDNYTTFYSAVKEQMYTDEFTEFLTSVIEYADSSANQSDALAVYKTTIQSFIDNIQDADWDEVLTLQEDLDNALQQIGVDLLCYESKFNLLDYVLGECQAGRSYSLGELYQNKQEEMQELCIYSDYVTEADIVGIAEASLTEDSYSTVCSINHLDTYNLICDKKTSGLTLSQIAIDLGYTEEAITEIHDKCEAGDITDAIKDDICQRKLNYKSHDEVVLEYNTYATAQITTAFLECAYPELNEAVQSSICTMKGQNEPVSKIQSEYPLYDPETIEDHFDDCPSISESIGQLICFCKTYPVFASFLATLKAEHGEEEVTEYYNNSCDSKDTNVNHTAKSRREILGEAIRILAAAKLKRQTQ